MSTSREVDWFKRFPNGGGTVYVRPSDSGDSPKSPESERPEEPAAGTSAKDGADRG